MKKLFALILFCAAVITANAQSFVEEVTLKDASKDVKSYISLVGNSLPKDSLVSIDADSVLKVVLVKGIKSRTKTAPEPALLKTRD